MAPEVQKVPEGRNYRIFIGYLWAVTTVATLFLLFDYLVPELTGSSPVSKALPLLIAGVLANGVWVFSWVAFSALAPFLFAVAIGERFSISGISFYLMGGALTGMLLSPLVAMFTAPILAKNATHSLLELASLKAQTALLFGAAGGLVYWWKSGRLAGSEKRLG